MSIPSPDLPQSDGVWSRREAGLPHWTGRASEAEAAMSSDDDVPGLWWH